MWIIELKNTKTFKCYHYDAANYFRGCWRPGGRVNCYEVTMFSSVKEARKKLEEIKEKSFFSYDEQISIIPIRFAHKRLLGANRCI
jgi:hypothetical protein